MADVRRQGRSVGCPRSRAGLAVILVLGLMAFAVLLFVSLQLLTKVEGSVAERSIQQAAARQHAALALQVAFGQLQKSAGPDQRITATAEAFGGSAESRRYTGVWDAASPGIAPLTWLISGSERGGTEIPPLDGGPSVVLMGASDASANDEVRARLQSIKIANLPGLSGPCTVGHYAWWVGDEGVKASVTPGPSTDEVTYPPFNSEELRRRLKQQLVLGAGPADLSGHAVFEPRDAGNSELAPRVTTLEQVSFLKSASANETLGWSAVRRYRHDWTIGHSAVLADPRRGGLRQDLSAVPELLGAAFAAWANPAAYMENPLTPLLPTIAPSYPAMPRESLRRRYRLTAPLVAGGVAHSVAPVLSYFLLSLNVRTDPNVSGAKRPLEIRTRWLVSLWNPYSSALVQEDLQLEVEHLPALMVTSDTEGTASTVIGLDALFGAPLRVSLPWISDGRPDRQSWFPGRVHTWAAKEDLNKGNPPPSAGFASVFYTRTLSTAAGQGVQRTVPGATLLNSSQAHLSGNQTQLTLRLYRASAAGGRELLRTFLSPTFDAFSTAPAAINAANYQITFVFHLAESTDTAGSPNEWLTTAGRDPRETTLPSSAYLPGPNGPHPELYPNYTAVSFPDRLLDRALPASPASVTGQSYNEDAPVFELPRGPLLSLGALQHLAIVGARPFAVGNSWGSAGGWNSGFDRFFLSGLTTEVAPGIPRDSATLPNPFLRLASARGSPTAPSLGDVIAESPAGYASKFLLQAGAFNVNSVSPAAWLAVLRSGRLAPGEDFKFLDASAATGTASDDPASATLEDEILFFRFPASAQETYRADPGYAASTTTPPAAPNQASRANTHLYRRGARAISMDQAVALARTIADLMKAKHADSGPFRSIEEFLAPLGIFGGKNLLEKAIAEADGGQDRPINDPAIVPEFSSQWLTSGDVMTSLAPILTVRSDTFRIRGYGDAVNPATGEISGRAWAEAVVQRMPDYLDEQQDSSTRPSDLSPTNHTFGRRFRVVAFRWLDAANL